MHDRFSTSRVCALGSFLILAASTLPAPAMAQAREVKTWPSQSTWRTTLVERPTGDYMCMLNGLGSDPHPFGVSIIEMPGHLILAVDDRDSKEGYLPTMAVQIDDDAAQTFTTFNDPPMTSTAPTEGVRVRVLITRLARGQTLTVDARRTQYKLSLDGFRAAAAQLRACRLEVATMPSSTVGRGRGN